MGPGTRVKLPSIAELTSNSPPQPPSESRATFSYPNSHIPVIKHRSVGSDSSSETAYSQDHGSRQSPQAQQMKPLGPVLPSYSGYSAHMHVQPYPPQPVFYPAPYGPGTGPEYHAMAQRGMAYYQPPRHIPQHLPLSSQSPQPPSQQYPQAEIVSRAMNECHRCGTTNTPEWRRGPNGLRTLCNACGLYHAKLVKRKGAALAAEEVLNSKVRKGKNGRRYSLRKQEKTRRPASDSQVTIIPPIPVSQPPVHPSAVYPPPGINSLGNGASREPVRQMDVPLSHMVPPPPIFKPRSLY